MSQLEEFEKLESADRREQLLSWLTPGRKVAIVGVITLLPALGIGGVLNGLFFQSAARTGSSPARAQPAATPPPAVPAGGGELERLRAEVALADQRQMLERLQGDKKRQAPPPATSRPRVLTAQAERTVLPPPPPPAQMSFAPRLLPPVAPSPSGNPVRLAYLGSSQDQPQAQPTRSNTPVLSPPAIAGGSATAPARPVLQPQATSLDPDLEGAAEQRLPASATTGAIAATTLAVGVLERPILREQTTQATNAATDDERYVVVLTEPVLTEAGEPVLPVGTRILAQVQRITANGLVSLVAVALRSSNREVPLQGVSIRAVGGLPLVANRQDRGGEVAGLDAGQALLKGAEEGLAILNRASSSTQSSGFGGISTTTTFGRPNPLAALGSGLFGANWGG